MLASMMWLFPNAFEFRGQRYYFCDGDGQVYPLNPGEAERIAFSLTALLAIGALGFLGWAFFSFYVTVQLHLDRVGAADPTWLVDSSIIYPAVFSYWVIAWLMSCATWLGLSWRFADREPDHAISPAPASESLKTTKPLRMLAIGVIACAFVGQGFGDACVAFRGGGTCDFITFTRS